MIDGSEIVITHFINPHLFWYQEMNDYKHEFQKLNQIENELQLICKQKSLANDRIVQVGDYVALFYIPWNRYIRTKVLHQPLNKKDEFIVWAIDYGFPLLTKKTDVHSMVAASTKQINHIRRGGVGSIIPCNKSFWPQDVCDILEQKLIDATSIRFIENHVQTENKHHWGNLIIVNQQGEHRNVQNYFIEKHYGEEVSTNFISMTLKTILIPPWMSNDNQPKWRMNHSSDELFPTIQQNNINILTNESTKSKVEECLIADQQQQRQHKQKPLNYKERTVNNQLNVKCDDDNYDNDDVIQQKLNQHNFIKLKMNNNYIPLEKPNTFDKVVKKSTQRTQTNLIKPVVADQLEILEKNAKLNISNNNNSIQKTPSCSEYISPHMMQLQKLHAKHSIVESNGAQKNTSLSSSSNSIFDTTQLQPLMESSKKVLVNEANKMGQTGEESQLSVSRTEYLSPRKQSLLEMRSKRLDVEGNIDKENIRKRNSPEAARLPASNTECFSLRMQTFHETRNKYVNT